MKLTIHGAAREVTGSCHEIQAGKARILLDCGMIQGGKERHQRNRDRFNFPPSDVDALILSHAHIDHSGRLPVLSKAGFDGPIYCTEATAALAKILLEDSARIHEEDARWKIKRLKRMHKDHHWVEPLFDSEDAQATLEQLRPVPFDTPIEVAKGVQARFVKAGHILGAAITVIDLPGGKNLVFSGDLGVEGARLLSAPHAVPSPDHLLMESTYGDRSRDDGDGRTERLFGVIERAAERGGKVIIPSFAVGRTQEILARINDLVESGKLTGVPVFVDSPMAISATRVFGMHPESYSKEARELLHAGDAPLEFDGLKLTRSVEDSKAINEVDGPAVVISASGMCTAGRIKHHLKNNLGDPNSTVLFVGYQAYGSLGRVIQQGTNPVRIFGEWLPVRARIETIEGFSAHADREELLAWFESLGGVPGCTYLVHGEVRAAKSLAEDLRKEFGARVEVPRLEQSFDL